MEQNSIGKDSPGIQFVPSLILTFLSTYITDFLTGLFLLDVTIDFFGSSNPVSIATASQLATLSSIAAVVAGLAMGILSVGFSRKILLFLGSLCTTIGTLGCFLAQDFIFMQIFYPIEGVGTIMVGAMTFALVGELLIAGKRARATGFIIAGATVMGIVGSLVARTFFADPGGWRSFLLWFALPISLMGLASAYFGVPSPPRKSARKVGKKAYLSSFKQVFLKKSAAGCLIGNMIRSAATAWGTFSMTFFRKRFDLPLASAALILLGGTIVLGLANIVGGHLVNRIGRKRLLVTTLVFSSPTLAFLAFVPNLHIALVLYWSGNFFYAMTATAGVNLTLEQAPESRGTMMSINSIFRTLGNAIGVALGGAALALFNDFNALIFTFIALSLASAAIYFFLTKDPYKNISG